MSTWNGRCYVVTGLVLALLLCPAGTAWAARVEVELSASAVALGVPGSRTGCLARFDLPECLMSADIDLAVVELRADIETDPAVAGVTLQAYLVTEEWTQGGVDWSGFTGGGDEPFDQGRHAMWTATAGEGALVRLDVTEMVAAWASGETPNRGFVVVPSLGEEAAMLSIPAEQGRGGSVTMTVWYTAVDEVLEPDGVGRLW